MNIGKQGNAEIHDVAAQVFALPRAFKRHAEGGGGGHRAHRGQVSRAVMADHFQSGFARVKGGGAVKHGKPEVVPHQDDQDDDQEDRQLADGSLPGKGTEGDRDKRREDRNHNPLDNRQHDPLELLQYGGDRLCPGPYGRETQQDGNHQRGHHGHDLRNVQLKGNRRQFAQAVRIAHNIQVRNDGISGAHGQKSGQQAGHIGGRDRHRKHFRRAAAHLGDGGRDKADNDQGYAEINDLAQNVFQRHDDLHGAFREEKTRCETDGDRQQKPDGEALQQFHGSSAFPVQFTVVPSSSG